MVGLLILIVLAVVLTGLLDRWWQAGILLPTFGGACGACVVWNTLCWLLVADPLIIIAIPMSLLWALPFSSATALVLRIRRYYRSRRDRPGQPQE